MMTRIGAGKEVKKQQPIKVKHVPQRTCIACRQTMPKRSLMRLVRTPEGVQLDPTGKLTGRGAYLHDSRKCWKIALQRGLLAKNLKTDLTEADLNKLHEWMGSLPEIEQE